MVGFALGNVFMGWAIDKWLLAPGSGFISHAGGRFFLAVRASSITEFVLVQKVVLIGTGCASILGPLISDVSHWFERRRRIAGRHGK